MEISDEIFRINITQMQDNIHLGCGYCKHQTVIPKTRIKNDYKITTKSIPLNLYQSLVEKGWTRCGNRLYKKNYEKSCCKLYQPRININNFKISKEQRKIMKRFRKYLSGEYETNKITNTIINVIKSINVSNNINLKENTKKEDEIQNKIDEKLKQYISSQNFLNILNQFIQNEDAIGLIYEKLIYSKIRKNNNKKLEYDYSCDLIFIIKNVLKQLRKKNEINDKNENINKNEIINIQSNQTNDDKNFINGIYNDLSNYYKSDNYYENQITISFNETTGHINFKLHNEIKINKEPKIVQQNNQNNYINKINVNDNNKININSQKEKYIFDYFKEIVPEPEIYLPLKHKYTIELTDKIKLESTDERYLLYSKYQSIVHKEETTVEDYNNFLGISPINKKEIKLPLDFNNKTKHPELYPKYYGTYDLIHRIDEKIVAVTVIDILPNYLESHYCYYDPDFSFLDLGVITAIREIEYMKSFQELVDKNLMYYTMGEMSLSVSKLKYKGNYFPTEIMDNYTGIYVLLTEEVKKLISDNECHHLISDEKNKNALQYFYKEEIDYYYNNIIIDIMGDKLLVEDFLNLYFEGNIKAQNLIRNNLKKFLGIIDIETFTKINFYFDNTE